MASLVLSPPPLAALVPRSSTNLHAATAPVSVSGGRRRRYRRLAVASSALAESGSPKPLAGDGGGRQDGDDEPLLPLLEELADCLVLPPDYLAKLPRDLRLDLNDAAFDLSNGPVLDECGQELGDLLLNLARAWETADTATSNSLAKQLPSMGSFLTGSAKSAFGKRLVSAGRRFEAMGQYGEGELQRVAKTMVKNGKLLSRRPVIRSDEEARKESRKLKFGEIEFELTPEKANIGAAVGLLFGILSWQLSQGVESIPESSLQYANDNALLLAKSLRGALLALCYSSTILSAFVSVGLVLLGRQLSSESESK